MDYEIRFAKLPCSPKSCEDRMTPRSQKKYLNSPALSKKISSIAKKSFNGFDFDSIPSSPVLSSPLNKSNTPRKVSKKPLDTIPFSMNLCDFYIHPIDWSVKDIIALGRIQTISLIYPKTQSITDILCRNEAESLKFLTNGYELLVGCENGSIYQFNTVTKEVNQVFNFGSDKISCIDSGNYFSVFSLNNGKVGIFDTRTSEKSSLNISRAHDEICISVKINPINEYIFASSGNENSVKIWDVRKEGKPLITYENHMSAVRAMAWSPCDENLIATGGGISDKKLNIWNINNGKTIKSAIVGSQICDIYWNKEYKELITTEGYASNGISLWNESNLTNVATIAGHHERILYSAISPRRDKIATVTTKDPIQIWNIFPKKHEVINIR